MIKKHISEEAATTTAAQDTRPKSTLKRLGAALLEAALTLTYIYGTIGAILIIAAKPFQKHPVQNVSVDIDPFAAMSGAGEGRPLTPCEISDAKYVLGDRIPYDEVKVHPVSNMPPNFVGFERGNDIYITTDEYRTDFSCSGKPLSEDEEAAYDNFGHELTHIFQAQTMEQERLDNAEREAKLKAGGNLDDVYKRAPEKKYAELNPEQQAERGGDAFVLAGRIRSYRQGKKPTLAGDLIIAYYAVRLCTTQKDMGVVADCKATTKALVDAGDAFDDHLLAAKKLALSIHDLIIAEGQAHCLNQRRIDPTITCPHTIDASQAAVDTINNLGKAQATAYNYFENNLNALKRPLPARVISSSPR